MPRKKKPEKIEPTVENLEAILKRVVKFWDFGTEDFGKLREDIDNILT